MRAVETCDNTRHIGLNALLLSIEHSYRSAGISNYIYNLLIQFDHTQRDFRWTAFTGERKFKARNLALHYAPATVKHAMARIAWEQLVLPRRLRQAGVHMLHAMAFVAPLTVPLPVVITIFDLSFERFPQAFKAGQRWYLRLFTRLSARRASRIITISESTRRDVMHFLGIPATQIETIYCGVASNFRRPAATELEAFRSAHSLPQHFVLFLGTIEPRKNIEGLVRAYELWHKRDAKAPPLAIAGARGWYYQRVFEAIEEAGLQKRVLLPGYIPVADLPAWYSAAGMFVYPSLYEGFGLPVLEAMACGTPVIAGNAASLPEIVADCGILVDPYDVQALSLAMENLWYNREQRQALSESGLARAAEFSWERSARQTMSVYASVIQN